MYISSRVVPAEAVAAVQQPRDEERRPSQVKPVRPRRPLAVVDAEAAAIPLRPPAALQRISQWRTWRAIPQ
jgi:hypothetical protein